MTLACSIGSGRTATRRFAGALRRLVSDAPIRDHAPQGSIDTEGASCSHDQTGIPQRQDSARTARRLA